MSSEDTERYEYCPICADICPEHREEGRPENDFGCDNDGPICENALVAADDDVLVWHCHNKEQTHCFFDLDAGQLAKYTVAGPWPRVCLFFQVIDPDFYDRYSGFTCRAKPDGSCSATAVPSGRASGVGGSLLLEPARSEYDVIDKTN